jgi:hypothetical protein
MEVTLMTKEEVKNYAVFMNVSELMEEMLEHKEDAERLHELLKLCDGEDEYTRKFFPNGDSDFYALIKNPPDLDNPSDGFSDISERTWLECCCSLAWNYLNK